MVCAATKGLSPSVSAPPRRACPHQFPCTAPKGLSPSVSSVGGNVKIGNSAAVYPGARIVPNRKIGDNAVVGICSVVLLNVATGTTVFGNPAAPIARL